MGDSVPYCRVISEPAVEALRHVVACVCIETQTCGKGRAALRR